MTSIITKSFLTSDPPAELVPSTNEIFMTVNITSGITYFVKIRTYDLNGNFSDATKQLTSKIVFDHEYTTNPKMSIKRLKSPTFFLAALVLFQGCVIYHKTPSTLEQASKELIKTKITATDMETHKYKYVIYDQGVYYGVNKKSGEIIKTPLNPEDILKVAIKNRSASTWVTIGASILPIGLIVAITTYTILVPALRV